MDMILTYMKISLYHNNSLKLIIVSATMDDDEPRYRRFYRDINDNRMYPFNTNLIDNKLDRINVDRRLHIWPPSEIDKGGTTYPIKDIWNQDPSFEGIVKLALNLIETQNGDILIFQPGTKEISKMVTELNNRLPINAIAIPYHGKMDQNKKNLIENLSDEDKRRLTYPKTVPYDTKEEPEIRVPQGTYDRVIVIATNLAEASITISTLKFVIETGTQKIDVYDYVNRISKIKLVPISESSRKQRRGRVGRKSSGTVYYTYGPDDLKNNKINFNISIEPVYTLLYELLKDSRDKIPLINPQYDPNNRIKFQNLDKIISGTTISEVYPGNLDVIILKQYKNWNGYLYLIRIILLVDHVFISLFMGYVKIVFIWYLIFNIFFNFKYIF